MANARMRNLSCCVHHYDTIVASICFVAKKTTFCTQLKVKIQNMY